MNKKQKHTSKQSKDRFSPKFHIRPAKGYLNDPNGLVYYR